MSDPSAGAAAQLCWLQLHDSAFPAGRFVHSNGLESWLAAHPEAGEPELMELVHAYLGESVGTLDAPVAAHAWAATALPDQLALDHLLTSYKITESARAASEGTGRQLALTARRALPPAAGSPYLDAVAGNRTPGNQAVVEGVLQRLLGIGREQVVLGLLRSAHTGLLSAAIRLGRLGPMASVRLQYRDHALLAGIARRALATTPAELSSCLPDLEIHAMRHESTTARLFRT
jgi:urease accessory protein